MDLLAVLVFVFLGVWGFMLLRPSSRPRHLPPGPRPLPIIGNIHQLGRQSHKTLSHLSKTYGPLMSLQLGSKYAIVISCPEIAKEVLQKHDLAFSGRVIPDAAEAYGHHKYSMLFLPVGSQWRKLRKLSKEQMFTSQRLKATQQLRQEKLTKMVDFVSKCCQGGRPVNLREASFVTTLNLMSATLFSTEVSDYDSDATQEFRDIFESLTNLLGQPNVADFFPIFRQLDPQGVRKKSNYYFGKLFGLIGDIINQRLRSRSPSDSPKKTDFLETLIDVSQEGEYQMSMEVIKVILGDLFGGGSDTTSISAEWAMRQLLLNPDKLSKAKHELLTVIGDDRKKQIQESDISNLPYIQALVKETFRLHPAAPFLIPRVSVNEVQLRGYTIPKGTNILVNAWAIGRDPSIWSNPEAFEPERFLDQKMDFKGLDLELIPFGFGRRMCPGLPLASIMLHMMLANLIHKFDWKFQQGEQDLVGEVLGLSLRSSHPLEAIPVTPSL